MKVNFVLLDTPESELERLGSLDPDKEWWLFNQGIHSWVLQSYLMIRGDLDATLSNRFSKGVINVVHNAQLRSLEARPNGFVLGIRADYPRSWYSHWEIVQNKAQVGSRVTWMPHWPQQALVPRSPSRSDVTTVGYFGRAVNHYSRMLRIASGFKRIANVVERCCAKVGLHIIIKEQSCWNDYSDVDVAIGVRSFDWRRFNTKPPTKMFNAWNCNVPFIGGGDSAYDQVGRRGVDYIRVLSPGAMLSAMVKLKDDEEYYNDIVRCGSQRAQEFSYSAIAESWTAFLSRLWHSEIRS